MDANYAVTSSTPAGTATVPNCVDGWVVAAKGIYIWVVSLIQTPTGTAKNNQWKGQLYSISTAGVLSTVGAQVVIYTSPNGVDTGEGMYGRLNGLGSYVVNNVSHVISSAVAQSGNQPNAMRSRIYNTVDLATVTVFTTTAVKQESVGANNSDYLGIGIAKACLNVGYDGSFGLVVTNLGTAGTPDVYKVNAAGGFVDAAVNYFDTYLNPCRYRNTTTKLSTAASNTNVSATNTFRVDDTALAGGTFTNLHLNCIWMYEMTGTNAEDDTGTTSLKGVYLGCSALGSSSGNMTLKVNGTLALTKTWNNINITASNMNWTFTSVLDIATTKLTFLTEFANSLGLDCKIGYGTNGGTYATPTGTFELSSITVLLT